MIYSAVLNCNYVLQTIDIQIKYAMFKTPRFP